MALAVSTGKLALSFAVLSASVVAGGLFVYAANSSSGTGSASAKPGLAPPSITMKPAESTTATSASFTYTGPSRATFQCSLDSADFASCPSSITYGPLTQGAHTFHVRAVSGSTQSAATSYTWTVDTTPPPAPIFVTNPPANSNSSSATFRFSDGEAGVSFLCRLTNAAGFTTCSNPKTFTGLADGNYTLSVEAKDAAGNIGLASSSTWTVDTVAPPKPLLTQKPGDPAVGATQTFAWTDSEAGVTFACASENGRFAACTSPYTYVVDTTNKGEHEFAVHAIDAAGNSSNDTNYQFKVAKDKSGSGAPFQISGGVSGLTLGAWTPVVVHIVNPNSASIYVTALAFSVSADSTPSGCLSSTNIETQASNISTSQQLVVPANGSIDLPSQGVTAPQIRLKNLATNQDSCKGKTFTLTYSGSAHN